MAVTYSIGVDRQKRRKRAWFYPEEEAIALILLAAWLNFLLIIT